MSTGLKHELDAAGIFLAVRQTFANEPADRLEALDSRILEACEEARHYSGLKSDRFERRRERDRATRRRIPACLKATEKLRNFLIEFPEFAEHIASAAPNVPDHHTADPLSGALRSDAARTCADFLASIERALTSAMTTARGKIFQHGYQVGPLIYPKHITSRQGARPKIAETGLAFQLTIYFRRVSAKQPNFEYLMTPEPMPQCGEPHYELTSRIIKVALGKTVTSHALYKRIDDLVRANPGIGLGAWPKV